MFTKLMDSLSLVYTGDTIYIPEKLRVFIDPWLATRKQGKRFQGQGGGGFQKQSTGNGLVYGNKKVMFFCEDALVKAYKNTPLPHVPGSTRKLVSMGQIGRERGGAKSNRRNMSRSTGERKTHFPLDRTQTVHKRLIGALARGPIQEGTPMRLFFIAASTFALALTLGAGA